MKIILVMGLPGAGKTTLANELAKLIKAKRLNADEIRKAANDWDFSEEGRTRQAKRMAEVALKMKNEDNNVISDFICPTPEARSLFPADYIVWVDTIKTGRFEDTNRMFEPPERHDVDYHVAKWFEDTHTQLVPIIERYMKKQNTTPIGYVAYRLEEGDV